MGDASGAGERSESDDLLLARLRAREPGALDGILARERPAIERMVGLRLDRRVEARVGVSDVVQEVQLEIVRRLDDHLERSDMPFSLWVRWIAREKVIQLHRRHLQAERRAVECELRPLPSESAGRLCAELSGHGGTPSMAARRTERVELLRSALEQLDDDAREIVLWRHFEGLSNNEVARLLGIEAPAASKRYVRALERLRALLEGRGLEPSSQ